jgi:hypothetical protein
VPPGGIEPPARVPQTLVLSIELWRQASRIVPDREKKVKKRTRCFFQAEFFLEATLKPYQGMLEAEFGLRDIGRVLLEPLPLSGFLEE